MVSYIKHQPTQLRSDQITDSFFNTLTVIDLTR